MVLNTEWAQVEVIDLINDGSGLAFGIIGGRSTGVVVKTILPGGVADRDGRLQSGDHILQIGDVNIRGLGSEQVAAVLRQCGVHVRMVVARPVEPTSSDYQTLGSHAPIVPTKLLGDLDELDRHLIENGYAETFCHTPPDPYSTEYIYTRQQSDIELHPMAGIVEIVRNPIPIGKAPVVPSPSTPVVEVELLPLDMALKAPPETETYCVELKKDELGLGITVAGYVCEKEEISGIFVKSVSAGSAADFSKKIRINDRIIEVDGVSVIGFTNHQAVQKLRHTGTIVNLKFERYLRGPKYEQLQQAIRANELKVSSPPLSPSISSLPKIPISLLDTSYIEPEGESRTSIDIDSSVLLDPPTPVNEVEIVIDEKCSVLHHQESFGAIKDKWREIIGPEAEIVVAELIKDINGGLGISLEGTVDVEDGREVRPHHYIRSVLPDGPVGRNGLLQSGDELLEVNNTRLLGLNHVEVVSILRKLPQNVCLICARYGPDSSQRRIIDTSQDRNAFAARNLLAGSLQTLIPMSEGLVKAKSESSLSTATGGGSGGTGPDSQLSDSRSKSRSLEMHAGLAMWQDDPEIIELCKGDKGLGFSILDYQDPINPKETVIVVRSLVPGGVAYANGRLIPGDRLLFVNETSLVGASLDRAVQVLKGAPKGTVRIGVAKPLSSHDTLSQSSQECVSDTDDHTCLEDYHECIEEYQECLEVMTICLDNDRDSFVSTPHDSTENINASKPEPLSVKFSVPQTDQSDLTPTEFTVNEIVDYRPSDCVKKITSIVDSIYDKQFSHLKSDSPKKVNISERQSVNKVPDDSDREGYETCQEEEDCSKPKTNCSQKSLNEEHNFLDNTIDSCVSEPCIRKKIFSKRNHVCLETKPDDVDLKSYDDENNSFGADQFFLVDYIDDDVSEEIQSEVPDKWISEPNVAEERVISRRFRKFLREYYNDYADCLEEYRKYSNVQQPEVSVDNKSSETLVDNGDDDDNKSEFDLMMGENVFLPIKSTSSPALIDLVSPDQQSEWDLYSNKNRRKSAFVPGYPEDRDSDEVSMTVTRNLDGGGLTSQSASTDDTAAMLEKHWGSTHTVQLLREPNQSLGISIVGGKVDLYKSGEASETLLGIFVKSVVPNSPAGRTGQFKTGDRILEVGGVNLRQATHEKAVEAIRNADNPVTFLIQSLIPWANGNENELTIESKLKQPSSPFPSAASLSEPYLENDITSLPKPTVTFNNPPITSPSPPPLVNSITVESPKDEKSDAKPTEKSVEFSNEAPEVATVDMDRIPEEESEESDDEEDVRELEGKIHSAKGHEIDRASAANVKRTKEEVDADPEEEDDYGYTNNKVKKKYASLGHSVLMVQLERGGQGLGLSLAGHRDRSCMAVFVCGLNPKGAAYRTGAIQVGDEILEVNGIVLHGRCHLNASAIIKGLSGPIFKVIILRRKTALEDIAVRPITQFPVTLADETAEERYASYPNVRTISIKKGVHSLGIMIIEGRHAEVGQGIFISDIQEGSSAEKAGLDIGEMILAVNKDSLLGASYDSAASLLKRTEGVVTLVVSNPNKRVPSPSPNLEVSAATANDVKTNHTTPHKAGLKTSAPPSRPTTPTAGEPIADPATCQILPGKEVTIEISTDNKSLGLAFVGGRDTLISGGIVILEIYPDGAAKKDGRLQAGDQIIEANGVSLLDVVQATASSAIRQILPKYKLIVFRPEKMEMSSIDVDLMKKPGKGLGLSLMARKSGEGLYIAEILNGSSADVDGRMMKGDIVTSVNDQQVTSLKAEDVATLLKLAAGRVTIKLQRHKPQIR